MKLGYFGRLTILFPIALGSALAGATVVHRIFEPDLTVKELSPEKKAALDASRG